MLFLFESFEMPRMIFLRIVCVFLVVTATLGEVGCGFGNNKHEEALPQFMPPGKEAEKAPPRLMEYPEIVSGLLGGGACGAFISDQKNGKTASSLGIPKIPEEPEGSGLGQTGQGQDVDFNIDINGATRNGILHLPPNYDPSIKYPLLIFLHGSGGNAELAMEQTGWPALADRKNFVAAFPNGTEGENDQIGLTWNAWDCCGHAFRSQVDDVGFLISLIETLEKKYSVDPQKVFLAGFSNGAAMALRFAVERTDYLAGVASVSGHIRGLDQTRKPTRAIPVIIIHGKKDRVVPFQGKRPSKTKGPAPDSVDFNVNYWAKHNGCEAGPRVHEFSDGENRQYESCDNQAPVSLWVVSDGGHAWPGGFKKRYRYCDIPTETPDATRIIWEFFEQGESYSSGSGV